jgi:hypothetical protein
MGLHGLLQGQLYLLGKKKNEKEEVGVEGENKKETESCKKNREGPKEEETKWGKEIKKNMKKMEDVKEEEEER